MKFFLRFCLIVVASLSLLASAHSEVIEFDSALYQSHIDYLTSAELGGRLAGTPGSALAAEYLASKYIEFGLAPGNGDGYFQEFEFTSGVELADGNSLDWLTHGQAIPLDIAIDYTPLFFSPNGEVEGGLVFAGYGISAADSEGYDDYEGLDVEGKVVVVLRHEPQTEDPEHFGGRRPTSMSDLRYKAFNARKHGAIAMLVVTGPLDRVADEEDKLMEVRRSDVYGESAIPAAHVKRGKIEEVMGFFGGNLEEMQARMDDELEPQALDMSYITARLVTSLKKRYTTTRNVIAILPGEELPGEYVIIGAHYDHIGHGEIGSTLSNEELEKLPWKERIHPGADDNASGCAGTIELARHFASRGGNRRTLVFMNFGAEELGILGSLHYVKNPIFPLERTVAMFNLDMIGRVSEGVITLQGMGTALEWQEIVDAVAEESELTLKRFDDGVGGSDYTSFYGKEIPVLNFFSGIHTDYSRPSDTADRINSKDAVEVLEIVANLAHIVDAREGALTFQKTKAPETSMAGQVDTGLGMRASLGTIPDYSYDGGDGVRLSGVREGGPADLAGIMEGDILVELGGAVIGNIYDFTYALQDREPGEVVIVVVIRDGERLELEATLGGR